MREVMASPVVGPIIKVIGIAGPGDPLANEETFETFGMVKKEFPAPDALPEHQRPAAAGIHRSPVRNWVCTA